MAKRVIDMGRGFCLTGSNTTVEIPCLHFLLVTFLTRDYDVSTCSGVVWCGVVWCGVVWCGVVCGVVWCGVVLIFAIVSDLNSARLQCFRRH